MAPFFACLLRLRVVVMYPAFIRSHHALQKANAVLFRRRSGYARSQRSSFTRNSGISEAHALKARGTMLKNDKAVPNSFPLN
jgi:hypothetical protein